MSSRFTLQVVCADQELVVHSNITICAAQQLLCLVLQLSWSTTVRNTVTRLKTAVKWP